MSWPTGIPKNMTPEQRRDRARNAAHFRASADGLIQSLSRKTLNEEQRARLAELLQSNAEGGGAA